MRRPLILLGLFLVLVVPLVAQPGAASETADTRSFPDLDDPARFDGMTYYLLVHGWSSCCVFGGSAGAEVSLYEETNGREGLQTTWRCQGLPECVPPDRLVEEVEGGLYCWGGCPLGPLYPTLSHRTVIPVTLPLVAPV